MTTEDLVETLIQEGVNAYKKLYLNTPEGTKLQRKIPVTIQGVEFSCWREYAVYKSAEWIQELLPDVQTTVYLEGNDSTIKLEVSSEEQQKLNGILYSFLKKQKRI